MQQQKDQLQTWLQQQLGEIVAHTTTSGQTYVTNTRLLVIQMPDWLWSFKNFGGQLSTKYTVGEHNIMLRHRSNFTNFAQLQNNSGARLSICYCHSLSYLLPPYHYWSQGCTSRKTLPWATTEGSTAHKTYNHWSKANILYTIINPAKKFTRWLPRIQTNRSISWCG